MAREKMDTVDALNFRAVVVLAPRCCIVRDGIEGFGVDCSMNHNCPRCRYCSTYRDVQLIEVHTKL